MTQALRLRAPLVLAVAAALLVLGAGTSAPRVDITKTAGLGAPATLTNDVPDVTAMRDHGTLPATQQVTVAIQLVDPNRAAEESLYSQLYQQGGPLYRQFWTPAEYAARFGAPSSQKDQVRSWLQAGGLSVSFAGGTGRYWVARGRAAEVEALFQVGLRHYDYKGFTAYANDKPPTVPSALGIEHVFLTDGLQAQTLASGVPFPNLSANPSDLWNLYNAPSNDTGQGEQLGILGYVYNPSDPNLAGALQDFEAANQLPQVPLRVIPSEAAAFGPTNTGAEGEWELDTQASSGMAPGATDIDFYDAPSANLSDGTATIAYWASDPNGPHQASASWGQCEDNPAFHQIGLNYGAAMTAAELQAVDEGRTLFASTGDTGSGCIFPANVAPVNVNGVYESPNTLQTMPAAIPYTVAVGGTVLYPDASDPTKRGLEYSWTHGGGGASRFVAEPDYQRGDTGVVIPCISDDSGGTGNTGVTCRGVPDVSILSGDLATASFNIQDRSGACTPTPPAKSCEIGVLGTSLSSPLWLGVWARVQAAAPKNLGFADEAIYPIGEDATKYAGDFNDIIVGSNGAYHAAPGWDYTTGWGTPNVTNFAKDASGNPSLTPTHPGFTPPPLPPPPGGGGGNGGGGSGPPVSDAACAPLWADPSGDDTLAGNQTGQSATAVDQGANPQLDLLSGGATVSADYQTLHFQLTIADLSKTMPAYAQGMAYWALFTYSGANYYVGAEVDPSGSVYYSYGNWSSGSFSPVGTATGSFGSGKDGIVGLDLPVSVIGAPPGAKLTNTGAQTWVLQGVNGDTSAQVTQAGVPAPVSTIASTGYVLSLIDQTSQNSDGTFAGRTYAVGEECTPPAGKLAAAAPAEHTAFSGPVATFTDKRTSDQAGEFVATIDWGDGSTSTGTVTGGAGSFTVSGSHTWSDEGPAAVSVSLQQSDDPHRPAGVAAGMLRVADSDGLSCKMLSHLSGRVSFSGTLGTCFDTDRTTPAGGLIAKVDWGDGSIVNYVTLTGGSGVFQVSGKHVYARAGRYVVTIVLSDPGGGTSTPVSAVLTVR